MDGGAQAQAPEDFRCPISLEIMVEPVILWTGQTYDRQSIQRWFDAGHTSCPKTKQELHDDTRLIPNYALRSLIHNWCQVNKVELPRRNNHNGLQKSSANPEASSPSPAIVRARQRAAVESLVKALGRQVKAGEVGSLRDSVRELRILAKESRQSRALISECGGIAGILSLLRSPIPSSELRAEIEENAVVALLNLSSDDENKVGLVAEGAVDSLVQILIREESSPDSKASAALAITSLAMVDVNKAIIGRHPGAVPALCRLITRGIPRGRKDGAIALYSLCMLAENRYRAVDAGVIPAVLGCISGAGEAALALLDVVSSAACERERFELQMSCRAGSIQGLVSAMSSGNSVRSRESAAAILCSVCGGGGGGMRFSGLAIQAGAADRAAEMVRSLPAESRAVRKANKLLQLLHKNAAVVRH